MPSKKSSNTATYDPVTLASIAASLMPRMECGDVGKDADPERLRKFYGQQRSWLNSEKKLDQDGTTNLDVVMEEALYRAHLLLDRANNKPSPTAEAWREMNQREQKKAIVIEKIKKEIATRTEPIPWEELTRWSMGRSKADLRKIYWRAFQASELAARHEQEHDEYLVFVWESEANLQQRGDPSVKVVPDAEMSPSVSVRAALVCAQNFLDFVQEFAPRLRKQVERKGGEKGRKIQASQNWPDK